MTRGEFLDRLGESLEGELNESEIQKQVAYYEQYIIEETKNGKNEETIIESLGDPWIIARSVISGVEMSGGYQSEGYNTDIYGEEQYDSGEEAYRQDKVHVYTFGKWWQKSLLVLAIVGILAGIISLIMGIISIVLPILIPVMIIVFILRHFSGGKR